MDKQKQIAENIKSKGYMETSRNEGEGIISCHLSDSAWQCHIGKDSTLFMKMDESGKPIEWKTYSSNDIDSAISEQKIPLK